MNLIMSELKQYIKELAKEAGFSIWANEPWGPGPGNIDWSSNYDKELQSLVYLLIEKIRNKIADNIIEHPTYDIESDFYNKGIIDSLNILTEFQVSESIETSSDPLINKIKSRLKDEYIDNPRDCDPWAFGHNVGYNGAITDILFILSKEFK